MNSYLSKYFHSAASSAISSIAESVAYRYWNTFSISGKLLFISMSRLSPQQFDNNGQYVFFTRTTDRWCWWWSRESLEPISFSATSRSIPQTRPSASLGCQRSPWAEPVYWLVTNIIPFKGDTFSQGCHISRAQSGVLPSLSSAIQLLILKFITYGIEWVSHHVWYSTKDKRFPDFIRIFVSYVPLIDNTARVSLENLRIIVLSLPDLVLGCTGL